MTVNQAIRDLSASLGDHVSLSKADLDFHGRSETHFPVMAPDAVVYPETTEQVVKIVETCAAAACPVIGWGTGTSLEGHTAALHGGVCVDFSRMDKLLHINDADMDIVVQPGLTRESLNSQLRHSGLFFPVDPGANASLGGMASTRASGTTAVRYGTMRENVLALEVVLADGRVIRTGSRARKSSAGYDLTGLFVGAEGTLGLITELTLRVHGQPEAVAAAVCDFPDVAAAVDTVIATIQSGVAMARIELLDADSVRACNAYGGTVFPERPHLFVEFHGSDQAVASDARKVGELVQDFGGSSFRWSSHAEERNALWSLRHNAYYAILGLRKGTRALVTDLCVPISELAASIEASQADIAASSLEGPILGHVGDGNFHAILLVDPESSAELAEAERLSARMVERALSVGGTATGEHGIGMGKLEFMRTEHGEAWDTMADLKSTLDPMNILNPGKLVRVGNA